MASVAAAQPWAAIIVVNWNGASDTIRCLDALAALHGPARRIYVVDNASEDGSPERILAAHPATTIVVAEANRGYAAAFNLGRARALAEGAAYLWLLNNDTTVAPEALDALVAAHRRWGPAIFSPKILRADHPDEVWYAGGRLDWQLKSHHIGQGEIDRGQFDQVRPIAWATGCSLFCSAETARRIGPMDERYFLYLEDVDWCLQAGRRGVPTYFVPDARVWHGVSHSVRRLPDGRLRYYSWRNYYLLALRRGRWWQRLYAAADLLSRFVKIAVRQALSPAYPADAYYHARTRGLVDVVFGRFGQGPAWADAFGAGAE